MVEPGRPIEGLVRDAETKEPIPGAIVTAMQLFGSKMSIEGMITTMTDAEGRYRLVGLPKGNGHKLSVYPPLDRPYFITEFLKVPASAGPRACALRHRTEARHLDHAAASPMPRPASRSRRPSITTLSWRTSTRQAIRTSARRLPLYLDGQPLSNRRRRPLSRCRPAGPGNRGGQELRPDLSARGRDRQALGAIGPRSDRSYGLPTYNAMNPREFQAVAEVDPPAGAWRPAAISCSSPAFP